MALVSPGVEVSVIDQSQYLPAPTNSIPLIVVASAQNKANASGTGVAAYTTAGTASKLYQIVSQRDLVNYYGVPRFYRTSAGTPINGYELNEYGLQAAYSALGVTNRVYVLRADIDLTALTASTTRPSSPVDDGSLWLNTAASTWGIYEFNATTGKFTNMLPRVITDDVYMGGGFPLSTFGNIGDYAVYTKQVTSSPDVGKEFFYKTTNNVWVTLGGLEWRLDIPTIQGSVSNPVLTPGDSFSINVGGLFQATITVPVAPDNNVTGVAGQINALGWAGLTAEVRGGKLCVFLGVLQAQDVTVANVLNTPLATLGIQTKTYYSPAFYYGTSAQMPLWTASQFAPRPSGSVWLKVGAAGSGLTPVISRYSTATATWNSQSVSLALSDWSASALLDPTGGQSIPANTLYAQYDYDTQYNQGPVYLYSRSTTGPTVVTGTTTNFVCSGPYPIFVQVSVPGSASLSSVYRVEIINNATPSDFVSAWAAAGIPYTLAAVTPSGALQLTHTEGGEIVLSDYVNGISNGILATAGFVVGSTTGVKYGPGIDTTKSLTVLATEATTNYVTVASTGQLTPGGNVGFTGKVGGLPTVTTTATLPSSSTALTITGSTTGIVAGMLVTGNGITTTTYVASVVGTAVTLSAASAALGPYSGTYSFSASGLVPGVNYTVGTIIDATRFTVIDPVTTAVVPLATTTGGTAKASVVTQTSTTGAGTGATFDISSQYGKYLVSGDGVARGGTGYAVGDQITFAGTVLGGATPANDLIVEVTADTAATGTGIIGFKGAGVLATAVGTASATTVTSAVFTASIVGTTMTVTSVASGVLAAGQTLVGTGIVAGTYITVSGGGGAGVYTLNQASPVGAIIMTSVTTTMTVSESIGTGGAGHTFVDWVGSGGLPDKIYGTGTGIVAGSAIFSIFSQTGGAGSFVLGGTPVSFSSQKIYVVNNAATGDVLDTTSWTAGVLGASALVTPVVATDIAGTVASQVAASNLAAATTTAIGISGATTLSVASTTGIAVGQFVSGTGVVINPGTTVTAVNTVTKVVTISAALGAAAVGGTYSYSFRDVGNLGVYLLAATGTTTPQLATPPTLIKQASSLLSILSLTSGAFGVGQSITGTTALVPTPATIASLGSGTGGAGTYNLLVGDAQYAETTMLADFGKVGAITYVSGNPPSPASYAVQCSNWVAPTYIASPNAPVADPKAGALWYYSTATEADIMVQKNGQWIGYRNTAYDSSGHPQAAGTNVTDANGPIFATAAPTKQSNGTSALQYGDLWIDTSAAALENYPQISRWQNVSGTDQWVLINNADSITANGILFADARWAGNGTTDPVNDDIPTIKSMLTSNWLDPDAPNPSLYPQGTLLFNGRRSGFNVKKFTTNLFTLENYPTATLPSASYTWVTASGNKGNGAPYTGRKAQRAMVVQALKAAIDTNTDIRDEDNAFNMIAVPGYPELQPNMVTLNSDRGETAYIIGDTPLRLADNATDIQNWATNAAGATSTGEDGCVTRSEYMGIYYPSGITNDLNGNQIVVPASHMMIRTFLRNDIVAYPWLAAAGTRRGTIDNASNIGYINAVTGEFMAIKTRVGIRDVLYTNQINPLVFFTGIGLLNYGNKNSKNTSSALDRTNVSRLVAYVRRQLTLAARPFIFEPNDALTRSEIASVVRTLFQEISAKRGIYDYLVVCDDSNNTPARIDRNELWIDVALEPVKAVEFIYIPVRILNTGELSSS